MLHQFVTASEVQLGNTVGCVDFNLSASRHSHDGHRFIVGNGAGQSIVGRRPKYYYGAMI